MESQDETLNTLQKRVVQVSGDSLPFNLPLLDNDPSLSHHRAHSYEVRKQEQKSCRKRYTCLEECHRVEVRLLSQLIHVLGRAPVADTVRDTNEQPMCSHRYVAIDSSS